MSNKTVKNFKGKDSIWGMGQKGKLLNYVTGNIFDGPSGRAV
jgi:hypothetical protein